MMKRCLICNKFFDIENLGDDKLYNFFNEAEDKDLVLGSFAHDLDYCNECMEKFRNGEIKLTKSEVENDIELWVRIYIKNHEGEPYQVFF